MAISTAACLEQLLDNSDVSYILRVRPKVYANT